MKRQVLKVELHNGIYTATLDDTKDYPQQYAIHYHYTVNGKRRKVLVDKVWSMKMVLAVLSDIESGSLVPQSLADKGIA